MRGETKQPKTIEIPKEPKHPTAKPVANPTSAVDDHKPIPAGKKEVDQFVVASDTNGGD